MCKIWNNVFPQNLPRLRRLQFWQPRPIFPLKMKKIVSCVVFFFSKTEVFLFCQRFSLNFSSNLLQLWQPGRKFFASVSKHHFQSKKHENFKKFILKCCSRCFPQVQVECNFNNPSQNFPVEIQVCFVKVQICWKKRLFKINFPEFFSSLHLTYCFDTPGNFFSKSLEKSLKVPKKTQKVKITFDIFFWKYLSAQL